MEGVAGLVHDDLEKLVPGPGRGGETGHAVHIPALPVTAENQDWPDTLFVEGVADTMSVNEWVSAYAAQLEV